MDSISKELQIVNNTHPLQSNTSVKTFEIGVSVGHMAQELGYKWANINVFNCGRLIKCDDYIPKITDSLLIIPRLTGGGEGDDKSILRTVALIAVAVAAPYLAGLYFPIGTVGFSVASMALTMVGALAVNALIPPASPKTGTLGDVATNTPLYSIESQNNQIAQYAPVIRVYGKVRVYPLIAVPFDIETLSNTTFFSGLYDFGEGDLNISDIKIGNTPITQYTNDIKIWQNTKPDNTSIASKKLGYQQFSVRLKQDEAIEINFIKNTKKAEIQIYMPQGFYNMPGRYLILALEQIANGVLLPEVVQPTVNAKIEWIRFRNFTNAPNTPEGIETRQGNLLIHHHHVTKPLIVLQEFKRLSYKHHKTLESYTTTPHVITLTFDFKDTITQSNTIKITPNVIYNYQSQNLNEWQGFIKQAKSETESTQSGLNLEENHTMLEFKLQATDQISGAVDNVSALCESRLRWHDGLSWQTPKITRNPAWVCLDILTGTSNPNPITDNNIDFISWVNFASICEAEKTVNINGVNHTTKTHLTDLVIAEKKPVIQWVNDILSPCKATLKISNAGKVAVLIDQMQSIAKQMITPDNSWGFSGERDFINEPDALKVSFFNEEGGYQKTTITVYNDGQDETTAKKFEELETLGITTHSGAWCYGRYMLAQGLQRIERFSFSMDIEYLAAERGDMVLIAHDVPQVGGQSGRIIGINNNVLQLSIAPLQATQIMIRTQNNTTITETITNIDNDLITITQINNALNVGDLFTIGIIDRVTEKYIIQKIEPAVDLTAKITVTKYEESIYTADTGLIPPFNPGQGIDVINPNLTVQNVTATEQPITIEREPNKLILLEWEITGDLNNLDYYDIYAHFNNNIEKIGSSLINGFSYKINSFRESPKLGKVYFSIVPVAKNKQTGTSANSNTLDILADTTPPPAVTLLSANIQNGLIELGWSASQVNDVWRYELRYHPSTTATLEDFKHGQHLAYASYRQDRQTVGARLGTYFIRALDIAGNASAPIKTSTSISELPDLDFIATIDEYTTIPKGNYTGFTINSRLQLETTATNSVYYFPTIFDLTQITESRIMDLHSAVMLNDSWVATENTNNFSSYLKYRTTNNADFMHSWGMLTTVKPSLHDYSSGWGEWRKFDVTDITGRFIQFALVVDVFNLPENHRVVIDALKIQIDLVRVIQNFNDLIISDTGFILTFNPEFYKIPALTASNDDLNSTVTIDQKTTKQARITLHDKAGLQVAGIVDVVAVGAGKIRTQSL